MIEVNNTGTIVTYDPMTFEPKRTFWVEYKIEQLMNDRAFSNKETLEELIESAKAAIEVEIRKERSSKIGYPPPTIENDSPSLLPPFDPTIDNDSHGLFQNK